MILRTPNIYIFYSIILLMTPLFVITTLYFKAYNDVTTAQIRENKHPPEYEQISPIYAIQKYRGDFIDIFPAPSLLGNISQFTFVLNHDICRSDPVDLLILIGSHPGNSGMRNVLRESWGNPRMDRYAVKLAFLFGRPDNASLQQQIIDESASYGDIIQGQFHDDYSNVTIRDLMGFRWTWWQCPQARFAMHIDDDICMSIDHILDALETQMPKNKDYMACFAHWWNAPVLRDGRYGVSKQEHASDTYDHYCWGWAYWFTPGAAKQLDNVALKRIPYRMNDAYLTGTLMTALGWQHLTVELKWTDNANNFVRYLNSSDDTPPPYVLGYSGLKTNFTALIHKRFSKYAMANGIPLNRYAHVTSQLAF